MFILWWFCVLLYLIFTHCGSDFFVNVHPLWAVFGYILMFIPLLALLFFYFWCSPTSCVCFIVMFTHCGLFIVIFDVHAYAVFFPVVIFHVHPVWTLVPFFYKTDLLMWCSELSSFSYSHMQWSLVFLAADRHPSVWHLFSLAQKFWIPISTAGLTGWHQQ